jgi:hypothetical protein
MNAEVKLLASLAALGCGTAAVVVVILLARSVLG